MFDNLIYYIAYLFTVCYITWFFLLDKTVFPMSYVTHIKSDDYYRPLGLNDIIIDKLFRVYNKDDSIYTMKLDNFYIDLFTCPFCLSFWVNILVLIFLFFTNVFQLQLLLLLVFSTPMIVGLILNE